MIFKNDLSKQDLQKIIKYTTETEIYSVKLRGGQSDFFFCQGIDEANTDNNSKRVWQLINKAFKRGKPQLVVPTETSVGSSEIKAENKPSATSKTAKIETKNLGSKCFSVSKSPKDIVNALNKHFSSIGKKLAQKLKTSRNSHRKYLDKKNLRNRGLNSMHLSKIEIQEIVEEMVEVDPNKAIAFDEIPPKVVKWAPHLLAPLLCVAFNKCLDLGVYPQNFKVAKVTPVHKEGDKNDVNNYRPISVLSQLNQIFERLISKRLICFFDQHSIISKKQFGFRKQHSTEHAILSLDYG